MRTKKKTSSPARRTLAPGRLHCIRIVVSGRLNHPRCDQFCNNTIGHLVVVPGKGIRQANVTPGIQLRKSGTVTFTVPLKMRKHSLLSEDRDETAQPPGLGLFENHPLLRPKR